MIEMKATCMGDAILSGRLANGTRYGLHDTHLRVADRCGVTIATVAIEEMTAIQRGGTDLVITLSQRDPWSMTFAHVDDARTVAGRLHALLAVDATPATWAGRYRRMRRRWWKRR